LRKQNIQAELKRAFRDLTTPATNSPLDTRV
jgi:hypothetical protein